MTELILEKNKNNKMPLISTWQSHVNYDAYAMVDLKVKSALQTRSTQAK